MTEALALTARDVHFDFAQTPSPWIPSEPVATHVMNVLHVMLPEGERYFVRLFAEALPLITDEQLAEQVRGFIGQEAMHARSHEAGCDYLRANGIDPDPAVAPFTWLFDRILGDRGYTGRRRQVWLLEQLSIVAAVEHFTAVMGSWVISAKGLDRAGADPVMLDLLRWHGAEEVEHRSVAWDLWTHLDGRYRRRAVALFWVATVMPWMWVRSVRYLVTTDPTCKVRSTRAAAWALVRAHRKGILPSFLMFALQLPLYLAPSYHPRNHGSTEEAVAYLGRSPAALAAG